MNPDQLVHLVESDQDANCSLKQSITCKGPESEQYIPRSDCVDAQADLDPF